MKFLFTLSTTVLFLYSFSSQFTASEAANCKRIIYSAYPVPNCTTFVAVEHKKVSKDEFDVTILLTEPLTNVRWFCGKHDGTLDWSHTGKKANEIRASFIAGELKLQVYWCDDLCGPTKEVTCAYNTFGYSCPGLNTSDHFCVFEIKKTTVSAKTTVDATEVKGAITANVWNVMGGVSVSQLRKRTEAKMVTYSSKSYIVVPSGYRFCSYSEAKTLKDALAPTGYNWQCHLPTYRQGKIIGQCTDLPLCIGVDCSNTCKKSGGEVISAFKVLMLILTAAVIVICF